MHPLLILLTHKVIENFPDQQTKPNQTKRKGKTTIHCFDQFSEQTKGECDNWPHPPGHRLDWEETGHHLDWEETERTLFTP